MNKYILYVLISACFSIHGFSQNEAKSSQNSAPEIYFMKGINAAHYINNETYYTIKFVGDELEDMEGGSFKIQGNIVTIIESDYDTSLYNNGKSIEDEKKLLKAYKDKELISFEKLSKKDMKVQEEFFVNKEGKLFYLFTIDLSTDNANIEEDYFTKISILCFVVNDKLSTISFPLLKSQDETEKNTYIKTVTESVDIFPSKISLDFLRDRVLNTNNEKLVVNYENAHFKFTVPEYLNVLNSTDKNTWVATFPDVNNIKNAVVIKIIEKEEYKSFKAFNKDVLPQGKIGAEDDKMTLLLKEKLKNVGQINGKSLRFQYMPKGTMRLYHAKKVTFETKNYYGFVFFNATTETYADNIDRFDAFLKGFEITD